MEEREEIIEEEVPATDDPVSSSEEKITIEEEVVEDGVPVKSEPEAEDPVEEDPEEEDVEEEVVEASDDEIVEDTELLKGKYEPKDRKNLPKEERELLETLVGPEKKRWKFILWGLFLGWIGAHLMYARRWFLLILMWAGLIAGVMTMDSSAVNNLPSEGNVPADKGNDKIAIPAIGVWIILWIGGTFFIKKDGEGNRM